MKIWKLTPTQSNGYVRIRASSEARAREIAIREFGQSKTNKMIHSKAWSEIAWDDSKMVICKLESDDVSNNEGILDIE